MLPRTKVKICGITNPVDAQFAVELGTHALGFIFFPKSPRCITPKMARSIINDLPPFVTTVAVVVNETSERVREILTESGCQVAQLHGSESPEYVEQLALPVIKGISVATDDDIAQLGDYPHARAILLDTRVAGQFGGTGLTFDWQIARRAQAVGCPIILAGGLSAENVVDALRIAEPYAIDISSGVESEPGKKDHERMRQLFSAIEAYDEVRG